MAKEVLFYSQFNAPRAEKSNAGSKTKATYEMKILSNGKKELVATGEVNIYNEIQSHQDSCDLSIIMKRIEELAKQGIAPDEALLNKRKGFFADVSDAPTSYIEMFQRVQDANNMFEHLPLDIRGMFNNSASEFFAAYGSDKFGEAIAKLYPKQTEELKKEVPKQEVPKNTDTKEGAVNE